MYTLPSLSVMPPLSVPSKKTLAPPSGNDPLESTTTPEILPACANANEIIIAALTKNFLIFIF